MNHAIELLQEIHKLMQLKGENPFKVRAFDTAARNLVQGSITEEELGKRAREGTLTELEGVGKGIADVLTEFLIHKSSSVRDQLQSSLPVGLVELNEIPGLGPKKAMTLVQELGIQSVGELEYACKENRLLKLKGFGPKLQQKILDGIYFMRNHQGYFRLADVETAVTECLKSLRAHLVGTSNPSNPIKICETGALRRKCETLDRLDFLLEGEETVDRPKAEAAVKQWGGTIPVRLHFADSESFAYELARTTATEGHWIALGAAVGNASGIRQPTPGFVSEEAFYESLHLPWISPEMRETGEEVELARAGKLDFVLPWDGVRGIFHNHTTRSDGAATLEQMVTEAERLGYEYIGVSDHSQSAFYAQGLKGDALLEQEEEVRNVQARHQGIRIFWGIESDILADGSLDYEDAVLKKFDFVIASIHSRFKMDRDLMTKRMIAAVRNPYTRFLGHPTGRLLLGRAGYDVDMAAVIAEAARCGVAVELNANPARLDLDWRWGAEMRKNNAFTSINPDAHDLQGLSDVRFGISMARKALLPAHQVINSKSVQEVEKWLLRQS